MSAKHLNQTISAMLSSISGSSRSAQVLCSLAVGLMAHPIYAAETSTDAVATPIRSDKVKTGATPVTRSSKGAKPTAGVAAAVDAVLPGTVNLQSAQQQEMVLSTPIDRIAIADPSVADALVLRAKGSGGHGSLLLFGKRTGTTNLLVWYRGQTKATSIELVVDGDDLKGTGLRATGLVVAGTAPNMVAHAQASELIRQSQTGKTLIDQSTVATGGTVQVDVKVVEVNKSVLKQAGAGFTFAKGKYAFETLPTSTLFGAYKLIGDTVAVGVNGATKYLTDQLTLSLLESNGLARVLAEPTLVAQSGHSASFLAGGEIPIPSSQGLGSVSVEYKPFGIGLAVTPTVLGPDRIALKVAPQASDLDYTNAVNVSGSPVPALLTRRADTTVELGDGESFVIGGLVSKSTVSSINKVPLLGDLPVIGAFFKNLNFRSEEKELVIIVTPRIVRPLARDASLPALPGAGADAPDAPVWTPYLLGARARNLPGFSQ